MQLIAFGTILLVAALGVSGRGISGRIVGGSEAPEGKYPFQVSLQSPRDPYHFCGGTVLNNRWILTAASCLRWKYPHEVNVVVGTNSLREGGTTYQADRLVRHPHASWLFRVNNIGLVRVSENIIFDVKVQPVKLAESDFTGVNYTVTAIGWGHLEIGTGPHPDRLQEIELRVSSNEACEKINPWVGEDNICTLTEEGEGFCQGDEGGPLTADGVQVGIASDRKSCAYGYPDIFMKVYNYLDWIHETMEEFS